jgi:Flp pilus assembly protein TadG
MQCEWAKGPVEQVMSKFNQPSPACRNMLDSPGDQRSLGFCRVTRRLLNRFRADKNGNVMITAAFLIPVVVGAVGAAISYSSGNSARTNMQMALDAAVLAGLAESNTSDVIKTAQAVFQNNQNKFTQSSTSSITADFELTANDGTTLTGEASGTAMSPFGGVVGSRTYQVSVKSAAVKQKIPICLLGLNGLDNGSFDVNGNPTFNADCAVQANSTSRSGMSQEGKAPINAKKFGVSGGHKTDNFNPPPTDSSPKIADPYASLPFPYYDDCSSYKGKGLSIKDDTTLSPGTYCGGITIDGSNPKVTLLPGIYVMVGGSFWVKGGAIVTGDRVMIAFTGKDSSLRIWGDSSVKLTSPISGTYMNMQFMQDHNDADTHGTWASIGGSDGGGGTGAAKLQYDGVAYFPDQNFWVFGNATMNANSPTLSVVADKIWVQGNATVNVTSNNSRSLPVTGPQMAYGVRLIK